MNKPRRPDPVDAHIGARIRMRRLELGISQTALGDHLRLTFQQIQKYEKGTNRVGGSRMAQIASMLGVEVAYFYPAQDAKGPPVVSEMDKFLATKDGLVIARAFVRIADPEVRRIIAGFIDQLSATRARKGRSAAMAAE
jgi:transcriptional regulator with XRE-family HTH domain